jgi:hypothetical protein
VIDALILLGWSALMVAFIEKAIWVTTKYRLALLGLEPFDWVMAGGVLLLFALTLAARTWVKVNEPRLFARRTYVPPDGRDELVATAEPESYRSNERAAAGV